MYSRSAPPFPPPAPPPLGDFFLLERADPPPAPPPPSSPGRFLDDASRLPPSPRPRPPPRPPFPRVPRPPPRAASPYAPLVSAATVHPAARLDVDARRSSTALASSSPPPPLSSRPRPSSNHAFVLVLVVVVVPARRRRRPAAAAAAASDDRHRDDASPSPTTPSTPPPHARAMNADADARCTTPTDRDDRPTRAPTVGDAVVVVHRVVVGVIILTHARALRDDARRRRPTTTHDARSRHSTLVRATPRLSVTPSRARARQGATFTARARKTAPSHTRVRHHSSSREGHTTSSIPLLYIYTRQEYAVDA